MNGRSLLSCHASSNNLTFLGGRPLIWSVIPVVRRCLHVIGTNGPEDGNVTMVEASEHINIGGLVRHAPAYAQGIWFISPHLHFVLYNTLPCDLPGSVLIILAQVRLHQARVTPFRKQNHYFKQIRYEIASSRQTESSKLPRFNFFSDSEQFQVKLLKQSVIRFKSHDF